MRDMVTELWHYTGDLDAVVDLDLFAFNELYESYQRLRCAERIEFTHIARASQIAEAKDFSKFLEPWQSVLETEASRSQRVNQDRKKLELQFGGGF